MFIATSIALGLVVAVASLFADPGMAMERLRPGPGGQDRFTLLAGKILSGVLPNGCVGVPTDLGDEETLAGLFLCCHACYPVGFRLRCALRPHCR